MVATVTHQSWLQLLLEMDSGIQGCLEAQESSRLPKVQIPIQPVLAAG